jgi:hypothetical protein
VLVALACLAWLGRSQRALAREIAGAALLLWLATTLGTSAFDSWTVLRYVAPFGVPALLVLGALAALTRERTRWQRPALAALALLWLLTPVTTHRVYDEDRFSPLSFAQSESQQWRLALRKLAQSGLTLELVAGADQLSKAQAAVPLGARLVSTAEQPWMWRYDAHTIHSLDFLGPTSPPPGMPFFRGADALAEYFTARGYTHLAFTRPRRSLCLYSEKFARANLRNGQWLWKKWAPYSLDFKRNALALARSRRIVFQGPTLIVVELRDAQAQNGSRGAHAGRTLNEGSSR